MFNAYLASLFTRPLGGHGYQSTRLEPLPSMYNDSRGGAASLSSVHEASWEAASHEGSADGSHRCYGSGGRHDNRCESENATHNS